VGIRTPGEYTLRLFHLKNPKTNPSSQDGLEEIRDVTMFAQIPDILWQSRTKHGLGEEVSREDPRVALEMIIFDELVP